MKKLSAIAAVVCMAILATGCDKSIQELINEASTFLDDPDCKWYVDGDFIVFERPMGSSMSIDP